MAASSCFAAVFGRSTTATKRGLVIEMRFMALVKATKDSEADVLSDGKASPKWRSSTKS